MRKLVFIAIIASLAMTGCIQKESGKKEGSSDKKVLTENVKLATCNINVGGIRFTKSKNGGENGITLNNISSDNSTISYNVTESDILNQKEIFNIK